MKIIKDGKDKVFYEKCAECATEFEYDYYDTFYSYNLSEYRVVKCPVCGKELCATLLEKSEFDFNKNFPSFPYLCGKC